MPLVVSALSTASPAAACSGAAAARHISQTHAWLAAPPRQQRRQQRRSGGACCQASAKGSDVGKVLRDALQQPQQGQNLTYLAAGNFLRASLGLEQQAEVNRILDVAMNPNSLYATRARGKQPANPHARRLEVDADLKPVLEFLTGTAGLSTELVAKAVSAHPAILCYSVPDRLAPFFEYLTGELALSGAEAARVVERRPTLLGVEVSQLRRMVGFLQEGGSSREEVLELLSTSL